MTDSSSILPALVVIFVPLSLVSVGGGPSVLAEMQHQAVVVHGWMTEREFADLFAISRAAPGPGALLATLIGWHAAGWTGALVASLAFFLPSSLLVYGAAHVWNRWRGTAWHSAVETGFTLIGAGLVLSGAWAMLASESVGLPALGLVLAVAAWRLLLPNTQPLVLLAAGAGVFVAWRMGGLLPP